MKRTHEPREYTNFVIDRLQECGEYNDTVLSLLNYLSDDEVHDWALCNGYIDDDDDDDSDFDDLLAEQQEQM